MEPRDFPQEYQTNPPPVREAVQIVALLSRVPNDEVEEFLRGSKFIECCVERVHAYCAALKEILNRG